MPKQIEVLTDEQNRLNPNPATNKSELSLLAQRNKANNEEDDEDDIFPRDLIEFSIKAETIKAAKGVFQDSISASSYDLRHYYAAPIISINYRDLAALAELFRRDDMEEIASNIQNMLLTFSPVPCWEDDPLDFLAEYL
jgi:hypothetical protein